jgi:uncharacterized protein YbjT (DUF2867 family)
VRALVRDPDQAATRLDPSVELFTGDIRNAGAVHTAAEGCSGIYISLRSDTFELEHSAEIAGVENAISAAAHYQLPWLGCISGAGDLSRFTHLPPLKIKHRVESLLAESGVPAVVFKPTHFMESLPMFVRNGKPSIIGQQPHRYHYLAASDYAEIVVNSFKNREYLGRKVTVLGPAPYTMREALVEFSAICLGGKAVGYTPLPLLRLIAKVTRKEELKTVATLFSSFQQVADESDPTSVQVVPSNPANLRQWCSARCKDTA